MKFSENIPVLLYVKFNIYNDLGWFKTKHSIYFVIMNLNNDKFSYAGVLYKQGRGEANIKNNSIKYCFN